jgi:hypothetical protein
MMILEMILYIIRAMNIDSAIRDARDKDLPSTPPPPRQAPPVEAVVPVPTEQADKKIDGKQKTL